MCKTTSREFDAALGELCSGPRHAVQQPPHRKLHPRSQRCVRRRRGRVVSIPQNKAQHYVINQFDAPAITTWRIYVCRCVTSGFVVNRRCNDEISLGRFGVANSRYSNTCNTSILGVLVTKLTII
jgi:hypothetical protein